MTAMSKLDTSQRTKLVEAIDKPLGFYVLSLFIVETFIGGVAWVGKFSETNQLYCLLLGAGLFVYITLVVTLLVWCKPHNLIFNQTGHLRNRNVPYGSDKKPLKGSDDQKPTESGGKNA